MRLLIVWAGIAAFVLIGLFPPETQWHPAGRWRTADAQWVECRVDTGRMVGYFAVVMVLTGGLLWSEPQTRRWFRQRGDKRKARAGNLDCTRAQEPAQPGPARRHCGTVVAMLCVVAVLIVGSMVLLTEPRAGVQAFGGIWAGSVWDQAEAELDTRGQINTFFSSDEMRAYGGFYGRTTGEYQDWAHLTPEQQMNRIRVCERAQVILDKAAATGTYTSTTEALTRAHLEVAACDNRAK